MYDLTPAPFGDVARRWTALEPERRRREVGRLLGETCAGGHVIHVDRPGRDQGRCYWQLASTTLEGDEVGWGWLAATHRRLLLSRGRAIFDHDPAEWGSICLELLYQAVLKEDFVEVQWLRRRVARRLNNRLYDIVSQHLERRRREIPSAENNVVERRRVVWDSSADLSLHLDRLLDELDEPTRDALIALAHGEPLAEVADRHGLSYDAVRQRVSRARKRLQPELTTYRRAARS